ncbi:MAG: thioredoxin family protein [Bacteroidetes bacterium]|nr:thioredoxin family protein [Bacteroidota bacterium]MCA6445289.1 thioredoxin family protein [Bacteroidota bacterium]
MKRSILLSLVLSTIFIISISFMANSNFQEIAINSPIPMPDYKMKDVSGKEISLNEAKTAKGLLVIFSCNTCPYVKLSESRIKDLSGLCATNQIGCILINSNEAQRGEEDSFDEMLKYYNGQGLKCYYSVDLKSQLANAFGATRTPQCFLFNNKGLIYKGAIDDNVKDPAAVKDAYLKNAIEALAKSGIPTTQETKSIGCTIKRLE